MQRARVPEGATEITLPDRGAKIVLLLRAGIVVGAMGADPESWIGLTEAEARIRSADRVAMTLRISDRGGPDWILPADVATRREGEDALAWCARAEAYAIATVPACGGYDDAGPVYARRAEGNEDGLITISVTDDDTGRALACASIAVLPGYASIDAAPAARIRALRADAVEHDDPALAGDCDAYLDTGDPHAGRRVLAALNAGLAAGF